MSFEDEVKNDYFEWLYDKVCTGGISYRKLLMCLHDIEFTYTIPNDVNRASDGADLRYRFTQNKDEFDILDGPCSVLEMMVALAIRCEETIMDDTRYGNRTGQWFWSMMSNLGINLMIDDMFDREFVEDKVYRFLDRQYEPNGRGGLFYIRNCDDDLRYVEIWVQLLWYLDKFA